MAGLLERDDGAGGGGHDAFEAERGRLFQLAYRMLGSASDAEDMLQETFIRWHGAARAGIRDTTGWLVATCTRLCIDELRSARRRRERYVGPWLPEPLLSEAPAADRAIERAQDVDYAFLLLLERLGPVERAIFLLHDIFEMPHARLAALLGRSEASVRQTLSRARRRLGAAPARPPLPEAERTRLAAAFFAALRSGDPSALAATLARDAELWSDGGGKVIAARNVIAGRERTVRFLAGLRRKQPPGMSARPVRVNGGPGLLLLKDGAVHSLFTLGFDPAGAISGVYVLRNPDKLAQATAFA
ncbi:MAG: RNA polymerase sigma factor SigJ [Alphaproteobacteria bacterium]|nr:RNA polymerase sigma factor SigJ [Alphaproteobacteria bacterium]